MNHCKNSATCFKCRHVLPSLCYPFRHILSYDVMINVGENQRVNKNGQFRDSNNIGHKGHKKKTKTTNKQTNK